MPFTASNLSGCPSAGPNTVVHRRRLVAADTAVLNAADRATLSVNVAIHLRSSAAPVTVALREPPTLPRPDRISEDLIRLRSQRFSQTYRPQTFRGPSHGSSPCVVTPAETPASQSFRRIALSHDSTAPINFPADPASSIRMHHDMS